MTSRRSCASRAEEGGIFAKALNCCFAVALVWGLFPTSTAYAAGDSSAGASTNEAEQIVEAAEPEGSQSFDEQQGQATESESEEAAEASAAAEDGNAADAAQAEASSAEGEAAQPASTDSATGDGTALAFDLEGEGTEASPYLIADAEDYQAFFDAVDTDATYRAAQYRLTTDIDLSALADGYNKSICASSTKAFTGGFDGGGHTISGMDISVVYTYQGLFGYVDGGTIENLTVSGTISAGRNVGGIVGYAENAVLRNLTSNVAVTCSGTGSGGVGGVVGTIVDTTVQNCGNTGLVQAPNTSTSTSARNNCAGGVVGFAGDTSVIDSCWNTGRVTGKGLKAGGIVGEAYAGNAESSTTISNCYNRGEVAYSYTGTSTSYRGYYGGIAGYFGAGSAYRSSLAIENCYNAGSVTSSSTVGQCGAILGGTNSSTFTPDSAALSNNYYLEGSASYGACGYYSSTSSWLTSSEGFVESKTEAEFKTAGFALEIGVNYADDTGTTQFNDGWPYLRWQNPDATYIAAVKVSLANENNESAENAITLQVTDQNGADVTDQFAASGTVTSTSGAWALDGVADGSTYTYTVSKAGYETATGTLTIDQGSAEARIVLEPISYAYTLTVSPYDADVAFTVGGAAVEAAESTVDAEARTATYTFTGLYNNDSISYTVSRFGYAAHTATPTISFADATDTVSLAADENGRTVTVNVSVPAAASDDDDAATLDVPESVPTSVADALAQAVAAAADEGETSTPIVMLYCQNEESSYHDALVYDSRSDLDAPTEATGGVYSYVAEHMLDGAYGYVVYAAGYGAETGTIDVAGADVQQAVAFASEAGAAWDGTTVDVGWYVFADEGATDYYLSTAAELAGLSAIVGGAATDYDGNAISDNFAGKTVHLSADIDLGGANGVYWTPIGEWTSSTSAGGANAFAGTFDGEGHTISNMLVGSGSTTRLHSKGTGTGLFSKIAGTSSSYASVQDLTIKNATVALDSGSTATASGAGILAATGLYANVSDVHVEGGTLDGSSRYYVGGVVGRAYRMSLADCTNSASVTSDRYHIGGVAGQLYYATATRCGNTGAVGATGTSYSSTVSYGLGGVVGSVDSGSCSISACYNAGTVSGSVCSVGGIIGYASSSVALTDCYNTGAVANTSATGSSTNGHRAGGIAGTLYSSSTATLLENCYSAASVGNGGATSSYTLYAGGILGYASASAAVSAGNSSNNYFASDVEGAPAGAIGRNYSSTSTNVSIEGVAEAAAAATMQAADFVTTLGAAYCADFSTPVNGGYPILRWQDPDMQWNAIVSLSLDTAANDDVTVTVGEDGTVSSSGGTLPAVTVYAEDGTKVAEGTAAVVASSDSVGYAYEATFALDNGTYTYEVVKKGYNETAATDEETGATVYTSLAEGSFTVDTADVTAALQLTATKYTYTMTVLDGTGSPLPDATVELRADGSDGAVQEPTGFDVESGSYTYELCNGSYWAKVSTYGYTTRETTADDMVNVSYGNASNEVTLTKLGTHKLTITATPSSGTFANLQARLTLSGEGKDFGTVAETAGDSGSVTFTMEDVAEGTYAYTVTAGGFTRATGTVTVGSEDTVLNLTLDPQGAWDGEEADVAWYTDDPDATEFRISSAAELAGLAAIVNGTAVDASGATLSDAFSGKTVYLDASVDLGGHQWTTIGMYGSVSADRFMGTFDGQGNSVSGLYMDVAQSTTGAAGLFGNVVNATIENLVVKGKIEGTATASVFPVGGIAGYCYSQTATTRTTFTNCGNEVSVDVTYGGTGMAYAAGLVGWASGGATFEGCYNKADIFLTVPSTLGDVGGLVAYATGATTVQTSYNAGSVAIETTGSLPTYLYAGGLIGSVGSAVMTVANSYITGSVSAETQDGATQSSYVGAVAGNPGNQAGTSIAATYYLEGTAPSSRGAVANNGSFRGTDASASMLADDMKATSFVSTLNQGLNILEETAFNTNASGGYPLLSWEQEIANVELLTGPDKTAYNDTEHFDSTGITLKVTYTNGWSETVSTGFTVVNGNSLKVGQTSVTIDYSGWLFSVDITVTQVEHETISDISLEIAGPVLGEAADTTATIASTQDGTYSASVKWTQAGTEFTGAFQELTYYRAEVTVSTYYVPEDSLWVLPEDATVTVAAADGTPEPLEVLYATRSDDGRTYTLTCTYALLGDTGLTDTASHLYYEGDAKAAVYSGALTDAAALTIAAEGEEIASFTLAQLEQGAIDGTFQSYEGSYSNIVDGAYESATYTGLSLYRLIVEQVGSYVGDDTEVTFVATSGDTLTLTMGDLRTWGSRYSEDGTAEATVPWLLAYGEDGAPLRTASSLTDAQGPLMLVGGQAYASDEVATFNVARIELGDIQTQDTRIVSFGATCDGVALTGVDVTVTDGFGNVVTVDNNRCTIFDNEEYAYTITVDGYTAQAGTLAAATEDETVTAELMPVYSGSYTDDDQPAVSEEDGAYLIYTAEELMWWTEHGTSSDSVRLMADIALNDGVTYDPETSNLWPVSMFGSTESSSFTGTFDGNGHTIIGMYVYRENTLELWTDWSGETLMLADNISEIGMFGYATGATIKNLGIEGRFEVLDRPDSTSATWMQIGAFVGYGTNVTIENCTANVGIYHTQAEGGGSLGGVPYDGWPEYQDAFIGGIMGTAAHSTVSNCYSRGELCSYGSRTTNIGGIVGQTRQYSSGSRTVVENCYSTVAIVADPEWGSSSFASYQGGIVGKTYTSNGTNPLVSNCVAANSSIDGGDSTYSYAQRVVGGTATVENCYGLATMTIANAITTAGADGDGADVSLAAVTAKSTYTDSAGWTENTDSTVTDTSTGWQFVDDSTPILYWESLALAQRPDVTAGYVESNTGTGGEDDSDFNEYSPPATFAISVQVGDHEAREFAVYTSTELRHMANTDTVKYSGCNASGPYGRIVTESIPFTDLLEDAGLSFASGDSLTMGTVTFDYDTYFGTTRYYFPSWASTTVSTDGAVEVPTSLVIESYGLSMSYGTDGDAYLDVYASSTDYLYAYMIAYGQTNVREANVSNWSYQQTGATVNYDADALANDYVLELLNGLVQEAHADASATATGDAPADVAKGTTFVTADQMSAFQTAIEAARTCLASETATNDVVMTAVESLESAMDTFDVAKQTGTKGLDRTGLQAAIDVADELLGLVADGAYAVSDDGVGVATDAQWVHTAVYASLSQAMQDAAAYLVDEYVSQADLDLAAERLTALAQAFEDDLDYGKVDIATATAAAIADQTYTGSAIEPGVELTVGGTVLSEGADYTLEYQDNVEVGQATIVVTGAGAYAGTLAVTFNIVEPPAPQPDPEPEPEPTPDPEPVDIASAEIADIPDQTYTGEAIAPTIAVSYNGSELVEGTDYTVSYSGNVEVGTATVTVTGIGSYMGTATATFNIVAAPVDADDFTDVEKNTWYYDGVAFVVEKGLMRGYDDSDAFGVGVGLTRAELAVMLWRYAEPEAEAAYDKDSAVNETAMADVEDGMWYTGAANWAAEAGVINGKENADGTRSFDPNASVTFEEMVAVLANYAAPDGAVEAADTSVLNGFTDGDAVSDWARNVMAWAASATLVNGYDTDAGRTLAPQEIVARERAAVVLMNAFDLGLF